MKRLTVGVSLMVAFAAGCLPKARTGCVTAADCSDGRACVSGMCSAHGLDAALEPPFGKDAAPFLPPGAPEVEDPYQAAGLPEPGRGVAVDAPLAKSTDAPVKDVFGVTVVDGAEAGAVDLPPEGTGCATNDDCPPPHVCNINTDGCCGPATYTDVDVSGDSTCAVVSDGTLRCWGGNERGQLVAGGAQYYLTPYRVPIQQGVRMVAVAAYAHTCVLRTTGEVNCWGDNVNGRLGCANPVPSSVGPQCTPYPAGSPVRDIVKGAERTCVRLDNGSVECWGRNDHYEVGDGANLARSSPTAVLGVTRATAISSNLWEACAVIEDGTVRCWGTNTSGVLGNGSTLPTPVATPVLGIDGVKKKAVGAEPGYGHACLLLVDGSLECFGENDFGQLGDGTTIWSLKPVASSFSKPAVSIAAGWDFHCAILNDTSVQCVGWGTYGQLGNGVFATSRVPVAVQLPKGTVTKSLSMLVHHVCALTDEGRLWCWGYNYWGQLGNGSKADSSVPIEIPPPSRN